MVWQKTKQFSVAENYKYKETDNIKSVHSTLKSHLSNLVPLFKV